MVLAKFAMNYWSKSIDSCQVLPNIEIHFWSVTNFQVTVVNRPGKWVDLCRGLKMPENPSIWSAVAMLDHFEKIQKLKDKVDGVPNFR